MREIVRRHRWVPRLISGKTLRQVTVPAGSAVLVEAPRLSVEVRAVRRRQKIAGAQASAVAAACALERSCWSRGHSGWKVSHSADSLSSANAV